MQHLTPTGLNIVNDIASRYNISQDAVIHMLIAVNNGGGTMAQFNCPELGGSGQWMRGGMIMVGDMFNHGLKMTVDNLCNELSNALAGTQIFPSAAVDTTVGNQWWPSDLGVPFSSGAQNNCRYAVFPHRLAVERDGKITVYDTLDHQISGVSQQQGGDTSLIFTSQYGTIAVTALPVVSGSGSVDSNSQSTNFAGENDYSETDQYTQGVSNDQPLSNANSVGTAAASVDEILDLVEKLARLRDAGVLSEDEFTSKKKELLNRL